MKKEITMVAALGAGLVLSVAVIGCVTGGPRQPRAGWEEPAPDREALLENSIGMRFSPVEGLDDVLFSIWETRVRDFRAFVEDRANNDGYDYRSGEVPIIRLPDGLPALSWEYGWFNPGFEQTDDHPVTLVSWDDAQAFCAWLTRVERAQGRIGPNQVYRLPRDWEWSVAVGLDEPISGTPRDKSGRIALYPWGTTEEIPPAGWGNYGGEEMGSRISPEMSARLMETIAHVDRYFVAPPGARHVIVTHLEGYRDEHARTSPVGYYGARHGALCDMGGNVDEWCEDTYEWSASPRRDRVLRGGSWASFGFSNRASYRHLGSPDARMDQFGFRVVLAPETPAPSVRRSKAELRAQYTARSRADERRFSSQEVREINRLYYEGSRHYRSSAHAEASALFLELIEKYPASNRAGCAVLYLGHISRGDESRAYYERAVRDHSDCWYADGVNVGAFANYKLFELHSRNGEMDVARRYYTALRRQYHDALKHNGERIFANEVSGGISLRIRR